MIWLWMILAFFLFNKLPKDLQTYLLNNIFAGTHTCFCPSSRSNEKKQTRLRKNNSMQESQTSVCVLHYSQNFLVLEKPYDMVINSNDVENKVDRCIAILLKKKIVSHIFFVLQYTLQTEIRRLFPALVNPKLRHEFHFVHRLDFATSGVICVALTKQSAREASSAFEKRLAKKYYLALVHGHIKEDSMVIEKSVGQCSKQVIACT